VWVAGIDTVQNRLGEKILKPVLDNDPHAAQSFRYDIAIIAKRRFEFEGCIDSFLYSFHCSLTATGEEVASGNTTSAPQADGRVIMQYRGLLVHPGYGNAFWWVKFPGTAIESVKGNTPEDAVNRVFERNLQDKAEKCAAQPEPEAVPSASRKPFEGRVRPGSLRDE
jgi:hypothetical protein